MKNQSWDLFEIAYEKWYRLYEMQHLIVKSAHAADRETFAYRSDVVRAFKMRLNGSHRKEILEYLKDRWQIHKST